MSPEEMILFVAMVFALGRIGGMIIINVWGGKIAPGKRIDGGW